MITKQTTKVVNGVTWTTTTRKGAFGKLSARTVAQLPDGGLVYIATSLGQQAVRYLPDGYADATRVHRPMVTTYHKSLAQALAFATAGILAFGGAS